MSIASFRSALRQSAVRRRACTNPTPDRAEQDSTASSICCRAARRPAAGAREPGVPAARKRGVVRGARRARAVCAAGRQAARCSWRSATDSCCCRDLLAVYRERLMEHQQVVQAEVTTAAAARRPNTPRACSSGSRAATGRTVDADDQRGPRDHRRRGDAHRQHGLRRQRRHPARDACVTSG